MCVSVFYRLGQSERWLKIEVVRMEDRNWEKGVRLKSRGSDMITVLTVLWIKHPTLPSLSP